MKKTIAALSMVVVMLFALVGCGGGSSNGIVGKWKVDSVEVSGMTMKLDEIASMAGIDASQFDISFDIKEDGTFTGSMADMSAEGEWKEDGEKYVLINQGQELTVSLEDGNLIYEESGAKLIMVRA